MTDVLQSALLAREGFVHGFSLRTGGVSLAPFESANLARAVGDDPGHVLQNHARLAIRVGYAPQALYETTQVHGVAVVRVGEEPPEQLRALEADALVTDRLQTAVGARTADCVPLLLADARTGAVGAVHAGWRGVVQGVTAAAIRELLDLTGSAPRDLIVCIGPHIRGDHFEVGEEVAAQIAATAFGKEVLRGHSTAGRPLVALDVALRAQLEALGIEQIDDVGGCTHSEPERFFSYRREGPRSGRHLAVIARR